MTLHAETLDIPANTPEESPTTKDWEVKLGVIHAVHVVFPSGCAGLVGVRISHGPRPIFPCQDSEWFIGDGEAVKFDEHYDLITHGGTSTMKLTGYNTDDSFDHTIYFRLGILPEGQLPGGIATKSVMSMIRSLFTRTTRGSNKKVVT